MMWAILSDIHANLEALQAVLADIDGQPRHVERILCLGDTIAYGPNPCECVDLVMQRCDVVLLGELDQAVSIDPGEGFHAVMVRVLTWTKAVLEGGPQEQAEPRRNFLTRL